MKEFECKHYWETGYLGDLMIYCTRCDKEVDEVYKDAYKRFKLTTDNGNLIEL